MDVATSVAINTALIAGTNMPDHPMSEAEVIAWAIYVLVAVGGTIVMVIAIIWEWLFG